MSFFAYTKMPWMVLIYMSCRPWLLMDYLEFFEARLSKEDDGKNL